MIADQIESGMKLQDLFLPSQQLKYLAFSIFALALPLTLLLGLRPINKATSKPNASLIHNLAERCTRCALVVGFEIESLIFNSPSPTPLAIGNRCSSINCIVSSGLPMKHTGIKPVAAPFVICHVQYFSSSWNYYDGCAAGGILRRSIEEQIPGCDGMTKRSASSLQHCARIAPPASGCHKEMPCSTTCR